MLGVEHPDLKTSRKNSVLETLWDERAGRFGSCSTGGLGHSFSQTLRGKAITTSFVDDEILELLYRFPILGLLELGVSPHVNCKMAAAEAI